MPNKVDSEPKRTAAYALGACSLLVAAWLYQALGQMGFPDGHLTELDRARQPLFVLGCAVGAFLGIVFLVLARFATTGSRQRFFWPATVVLVSMFLIILSMDVYLGIQLDDGAGG